MEPQIFELARKTKYPVDAFVFVQHGLDYTIKKTHGPGDPEDDPADRHIGGQQLCLGLRDYAIEQYGLMARTVLRRWNIHSCTDFGNLVFLMVDAGMMAKTEQDCIEDFTDVFQFSDAFAAPLTLTENS